MKYLTFLALALLAGTLFAGTGQTVMVDGGISYTPTPCPIPEVAVIKVQDAVVSWKPEVQYEERDVQVQIPQVIRLRSAPSVGVQSLPSVSLPAAPIVTPTYTAPIQVPQVQTYQQPMMQTYTAPQTVTYQPSTQTTYVPSTAYYPQCVNGNCAPPQMPSPNRHTIEYQPAQVGVNGVPIKTHNTPLRTLHTIRKALRDAPISPSPGSQSFR